jgi:hypothetical protein
MLHRTTVRGVGLIEGIVRPVAARDGRPSRHVIARIRRRLASSSSQRAIGDIKLDSSVANQQISAILEENRSSKSAFRSKIVTLLSEQPCGRSVSAESVRRLYKELQLTRFPPGNRNRWIRSHNSSKQ